MARAKALDITVNKSELDKLAGYMNQINVGTKSSTYIGPVLEYVHGYMSAAFNDHVDMLAHAGGTEKGMKNPLHHVYEWDMIGNPLGRLWDNRLEGPGANRLATFNWRASKKTVPVPDPSLGPNSPDKEFKQIHVFVWKAMVMEYTTNVTIKPKRGNWLGWESEGPNSKDGIEFSKGPVTINPGGGVTQGIFTATFAEWWGGSGASTIFDREIRQIMEKRNADGIEKHFPGGRRAVKKTITMHSMKSGRSSKADNAARGKGYEEGQAAARRFLAENKRLYIEDANRRWEFAERFGGKGSDE